MGRPIANPMAEVELLIAVENIVNTLKSNAGYIVSGLFFCAGTAALVNGLNLKDSIDNAQNNLNQCQPNDDTCKITYDHLLKTLNYYWDKGVNRATICYSYGAAAGFFNFAYDLKRGRNAADQTQRNQGNHPHRH